MNTGLTSVTFRNKSAAEIVECAKKANLCGIEWGGDIHVPPGDLIQAEYVANLTESSGLEVLSYGSYFRAGSCDDFTDILATAVTLNAPIIRIWAGCISPYKISDNEFVRLVNTIKTACLLAKEKNITVALEYHRGSMTETTDGALRLINAVGCDNLKTYWQPNPEISHMEHLSEIDMLLPWIVGYHVFYWKEDSTRLSLSEGFDEWKEYLQKGKSANPNLLIEFVKKDNSKHFYEDAKALIKLNEECR